MLRELAELTMLEEGDPQSFRVRAYESAAQAISAQASDLGRLTARELQQIEGIGKSTAEKIRELLEKGKVEKLEGLRQKHPRSVVELLRIQGLGPKALKRLRAELGVQSIDDLRRVLAEQKLRGLAGFGQKSEEKLAQSLARLEAQGPMERTPISVALPLAERIVAQHAGAPRRHPRLDLRVAAAVLRDGRRRRHHGRRGRRRAGDGGALLHEPGRPRARPRRIEDQRRHPARHADRSAGGGRKAARRGAALLHRLEGAQHQAADAGAGARADAQRVRAVRDRGRPRRRQRDRGADLPGARSPLHPAGPARGRRRDRGGREGRAAGAGCRR